MDRSGDPERKNPEFHTTGAPTYLHSEGKAGLQEHYLHDDENLLPTEEEMATLRRVPAKIPWKIYTVRPSSHHVHVTCVLILHV